MNSVWVPLRSNPWPRALRVTGGRASGGSSSKRGSLAAYQPFWLAVFLNWGFLPIETLGPGDPRVKVARFLADVRRVFDAAPASP